MSDIDYDSFSEEELFPEARKESRKERKIAAKTDRSKFKKTDREKQVKEDVDDFEGIDLIRGRVLSVKGLEIVVEANDQDFRCTLRGKLKKDRQRLKNLVAVGDFVFFSPSSENAGMIYHVEERKSVLSRADNFSRQKMQILAANIDQVIITSSVVIPPLKPFLIDRYILATRKGNMNPIVVINKVDLLDENPENDEILELEKAFLEEVQEAYDKISVPVILLSAKDQRGVDELKAHMKGKASVFSGQSGVGKSSLINTITGLDLRTGGMVKRTRKGSHTTTSTQLLRLDCGGWCIDTPGIGSFGLWDLEIEEIENYYEEIKSAGSECKFSNCMHRHEPGCAVKKAVEEGKISQLRFDSYQSLLESVSDQHRPR